MAVGKLENAGKEPTQATGPNWAWTSKVGFRKGIFSHQPSDLRDGDRQLREPFRKRADPTSYGSSSRFFIINGPFNHHGCFYF
jgi:hypothetical protein